MAKIDYGRIKFVNKGHWDSDTTYSVGDIVYYSNCMWILKKEYTPNDNHFYAPGEVIKSHFSAKTRYDNNFNRKNSSVNDNWQTQTDFEYINEYINVEAFQDTTVVPSVPRYRIRGIKNGSPTLRKGFIYSFNQYLDGNETYPISFSTEPNGAGNDLYDLGYVQYYINGENVLKTEYELHFNDTKLWKSGFICEAIVSVPDLEYIYYYTTNNTTIGNSTPIQCLEGWGGHIYWDRMNTGLNFKGNYDEKQTYQYNDVVVYEKEVFRAIAPTFNQPPINKPQRRTRSTLMSKSDTVGRIENVVENNQWKWEPLLQKKSSNKEAAVWFPGKGPLGWKYKHHISADNTHYRNRQFIDARGVVYTVGRGTEESHSRTAVPSTYYNEVCFTHTDSRKSLSRGYRKGLQKQERLGIKHTNDPTVTPKCIQIEFSWGNTLFLHDDGSVWTSGRAEQGPLGTGHTNDSDRGQPQRVAALEDKFIVKIAINGQLEDSANKTVVALSDEGQVYVWGYNGYGQHGLGHTNYEGEVHSIPQEFFGHKKVIDIAISGNAESAVFARTEDDHIYAWGRNNSGWHGVGDTGDNYRPVRMQGWDPIANGGIAAWQVGGYSTNGTFMLLDGNGFLWHAGHNGYGQAGDGTTSTHTQLTKSTLSPNGNFVDFWLCHWNGYLTTFMRHKDGKTYVSGHSGGYYVAGTGATGSITSGPQIVDKINLLSDVRVQGTYSDVAIAYWLTDKGEVWCQGYDSYDVLGNPLAGSNWTGEDGTYKPFRAFLPAGSSAVGLHCSGGWESTNYFGFLIDVVMDTGQLMSAGFVKQTSSGYPAGSQHQWSYRGQSSYGLGAGVFLSIPMGR